jgi:hypothetical protein
VTEETLSKAWKILGNLPYRADPKYLKYVASLQGKTTLGWTNSNNWRDNFKNYFPEATQHFTKDDHVHHAIPRAVQTKYPHLNIVDQQMHSVENLRGITKDKILPNGRWVHDEITHHRWAPWYEANPNATLAQVMAYAKQVDDEFGHLFNPPIR